MLENAGGKTSRPSRLSKEISFPFCAEGFTSLFKLRLKYQRKNLSGKRETYQENSTPSQGGRERSAAPIRSGSFFSYCHVVRVFASRSFIAPAISPGGTNVVKCDIIIF